MLLSTIACASTPRGEWLLWHGRSYAIAEEPLADHLPDLRSAAHFAALPTPAGSAQPGYFAQWQLDDDRLYLQAVRGWRCGGRAVANRCEAVTVRALLGASANPPVLADWFSGVLHLRLDRTSCGAADDCSHLPGQVRLTLQRGKLTRIENLAEAAPAAATSR